MSGYIGVGNKARKIKSCYIGIDGKARKIKKMYVGIGGKARLFYNSMKLPENISGEYIGKNNAPVQIAEFTLTGACNCTIKLTDIYIKSGSSAKVSIMNIIKSGSSVFNVGNSEVTNHPSSLSGNTRLEQGSYTVTAACFGVTGGQSGVSYYSGSMNYSIEFSEI